MSPRSAWIGFILLLAVGFYLLNSQSPTLAFWAAIGLFILGVPHGAVERLPGEKRVMMPTIAYTALYIVFGILVYSSWLISPVGTLVVFLTLSAVHFGLSEPHVKSLGAWVILGSFLTYPNETISIFSYLTGADLNRSLTVETAQYLAGLSVVMLALETGWRVFQKQAVDIFRVVALLGIFLILPPIIAVAIYFFCFHSLGEMSRTVQGMKQRRGRVEISAIAKLYAPASLPALFGSGVIIWGVYIGLVPLYLAAGLGVAFIIPHMLPVEKLLQVDRQNGAI